ncbi:MAG: response regulator transcription factor [Bacteroidia bacterium]|nr:response regulator transcription factor [Bacteroidia bacterium]
MPRILIADDHPIFRKGLKDVILSRLPHSIFFEAGNGQEALAVAVNEKPDLIILDIDMPVEDGIKACAKMTELGVTGKIIILTMHKNEGIYGMAMKAGAMGYVLKDNSAQELFDCFKEVEEGRKYVSPEIKAQIQDWDRFNKKSTEMEKLRELTPTEVKILLMVSKNLPSKEIAEKLFITSKSVENYRSRICKKLGLETGSNSLLYWVYENKELLNLFGLDR